ncbi:MAG: hypothetical protein IIA44_12525 [Acidobacteria bacterium]|nr:hypothetical protein [Acidobacteriota bacterium]
MNAIERLERANPVPDEDRLLAAPGAMDAFVSSVKERSGIVKKTERKGSGVEDRPPIEVPTDAAPIEGSRRRFGLVAAAAVVVLVIGAAAAILTLSGDGGDDVVTASPTTPGPITSFDDLAGTIYERVDTGAPLTLLYFVEDGTFHGSTNRELIVDRPFVVFQTSFEETKILITTANLFCDQPDQGGTYEILVLENGNLMFVAVDEDSCGLRSGNFSNTEWAPVP